MSIGTRDRPAESRRLVAAPSFAAFFLLIALLTGLLAGRVDPSALDQAYALYFTT
jgi:hypothetical protein